MRLEAPRPDIEMADDRIELVLKVAKSSFAQAIDIGACTSLLDISNDNDIARKLEESRASRAADMVQKALFQRLLLWTTVCYDPVRRGDYHLRVGIEALSEKAVYDQLAARGDGERLRYAIDSFTEKSESKEEARLRHIRNKEGAHLSELDPEITRATIGELLALASTTSGICEALALGTGIVRLSLESQLKAHIESAQAFWQPWFPK